MSERFPHNFEQGTNPNASKNSAEQLEAYKYSIENRTKNSNKKMASARANIENLAISKEKTPIIPEKNKTGETILDLRKIADSSGLIRGDDKAFLSDEEVPIGTLTSEKELYRSSGKTGGVGVLRKSSTPHHQYISKNLKNESYKKTLNIVRADLPASKKIMSKFLHQPAIESISEISAKTIARPSGIIGGGLVALIGSIVILAVARKIGFEVPYSLFAILFIIGFGIGLIIEFTKNIFQKIVSNK